MHPVEHCKTDGPWGTDTHPDSEWGTPGTISAFQAVAAGFLEKQNTHNHDLQACHPTPRAPWPLIKASFNDIALGWGGLFDNENTWTQPHKTHGKGQGGDFNHFHETCSSCQACDGSHPNFNAYLWSTLRDAAYPKYGDWDSEVNTNGELHLHVEDKGQGPPAACPAEN